LKARQLVPVPVHFCSQGWCCERAANSTSQHDDPRPALSRCRIGRPGRNMGRNEISFASSGRSGRRRRPGGRGQRPVCKRGFRGGDGATSRGPSTAARFRAQRYVGQAHLDHFVAWKMAADWAGRDLTVVGIAVDYADKVRQFAAQFKIDYPLLIGEQDALEAAAKFGMDSPALPFTVFTDRRGEVVALFVGELHRPQADFILSEVQNLNQDRIALPEARRAIADHLEAMASKAG
jgi:hypothetical protein